MAFFSQNDNLMNNCKLVNDPVDVCLNEFVIKLKGEEGLGER